MRRDMKATTFRKLERMLLLGFFYLFILKLGESLNLIYAIYLPGGK